MFDNAPIMWNHPGKDLRSEQGPDATKLAGFIEPGSAQYLDKGPKGPALYGNATILKKNREEVGSWVDTPFGLSIHASGELERPGDITSKVTRIDKVHSVDLVVKPGAGGAIVEVLESELLSVPTWNSHPLEPGYILSPLQESEDLLIEVSQIKESQPMLNLKYQLYEDDSSGNQYLYLGNESEQGFAEAAAERWSAAMGDDMQESDEDPQIFKDPQGNHFALVDSSERQEAGGALALRKARIGG